ARHPNIIPVVEGRWLADNQFAVVRARVRGSTLAELVSAVGPMPLDRVAATLDQVNSAVEWARANGVIHRHLWPDDIVFQQGSGRVLLALEPSPLPANALPTACDDSQTLGRLAWQMMAGQLLEGTTPTRRLSEIRPELSPRIVEETDALLQCDRGGAPRDVRGLIALLAPVQLNAEPTATAAVVEPAASAPVGAPDAAVVVVKRSYGFNARLATAIAVAAALVIMAL